MSLIVTGKLFDKLAYLLPDFWQQLTSIALQKKTDQLLAILRISYKAIGNIQKTVHHVKTIPNMMSVQNVLKLFAAKHVLLSSLDSFQEPPLNLIDTHRSLMKN